MISKCVCITSITHKKCKEFSNTLESLKGNSILSSSIFETYNILDEGASIIMERYNVSSLPSLILIDENENEICKISGNVSKLTIENIIKDITDGKYNWSLR